MNSVYRKPDQIVQPFWFGDSASKKTCLWLHNLPPLTPTNIVDPGERVVLSSGRSLPKWYSDSFNTKISTEERRKLRSKTFPGFCRSFWRNSGVNYYKMAQSNLKIQQFRANDIVDNGGKQFELGKSWCLDFFQIPVEDINPIINLVFKPLSEKHAHLSDYRIELKLAEVTKREDRKAYSNSETGRSQIKDFFIDKLHLKWPDNSEDYFAIMDTNSTEYNLYYIPQLMYENFIPF